MNKRFFSYYFDTLPDTTDRKVEKKSPIIYASALDKIYVAMKEHWLFDRFGFDFVNPNKHQEGKKQNVIDTEEFNFDPLLNDRFNYDTGEVLIGFTLHLNYNIFGGIILISIYRDYELLLHFFF